MPSDFTGNQLTDLDINTPVSDTDPVSTGAPALQQIKRYLVQTLDVELADALHQPVELTAENLLSVSAAAASYARVETPVTVDPLTGDVAGVGDLAISGSITTGGLAMPQIRAWAYFDGEATGTNPPISGQHVTSIERTSGGEYSVILDNAAPNTTYLISGTAGDTNSGSDASIITPRNLTTTTFDLIVRNDSGSERDPDGDYGVSFFIIY